MGFACDEAGNQTRVVRVDGSAQRFQYDAANRLIQVKDDYGYVLETLTYGNSNERLISNSGGYRTYFDCEGGATIAEYYEANGSTIYCLRSHCDGMMLSVAQGIPIVALGVLNGLRGRLSRTSFRRSHQSPNKLA